MDIVVTAEVLAAFAKDRKLGVQLFSVRDVGGNGRVDYCIEASTPRSTNQPQLIVVTDALFDAGSYSCFADSERRGTHDIYGESDHQCRLQRTGLVVPPPACQQIPALASIRHAQARRSTTMTVICTP